MFVHVALYTLAVVCYSPDPSNGVPHEDNISKGRHGGHPSPDQGGRDTNGEETIRSLVSSFLNTVHEILPKEYALPNVTYPLPVTGNIYLNLGRATGIKSFEEPTVRTEVDDEGFIVVFVEVSFSSINVVYTDIYLIFYKQKYKRGNADLKFKKVTVVAEFKVTKTDEIYMRILKNECVLYLRSLKVTNIGDTVCDFYNENGGRAPVTSYLLDTVVTSTQELLLWEVSKMTKTTLSQKIPEKQATVCRDLEEDDDDDVVVTVPITGDSGEGSTAVDREATTTEKKVARLTKSPTITTYNEYLRGQDQTGGNKEEANVEKTVEDLDSLFNSDFWVSN